MTSANLRDQRMLLNHGSMWTRGNGCGPLASILKCVVKGKWDFDLCTHWRFLHSWIILINSCSELQDVSKVAVLKRAPQPWLPKYCARELTQFHRIKTNGLLIRKIFILKKISGAILTRLRTVFRSKNNGRTENGATPGMDKSLFPPPPPHYPKPAAFFATTPEKRHKKQRGTFRLMKLSMDMEKL